MAVEVLRHLTVQAKEAEEVRSKTGEVAAAERLTMAKGVVVERSSLAREVEGVHGWMVEEAGVERYLMAMEEAEVHCLKGVEGAQVPVWELKGATEAEEVRCLGVVMVVLRSFLVVKVE